MTSAADGAWQWVARNPVKTAGAVVAVALGVAAAVAILRRRSAGAPASSAPVLKVEDLVTDKQPSPAYEHAPARHGRDPLPKGSPSGVAPTGPRAERPWKPPL